MILRHIVLLFTLFHICVSFQVPIGARAEARSTSLKSTTDAGFSFSSLLESLQRTFSFGGLQDSRQKTAPKDGVLVIGGTGKLGRAVVAELLTSGREVVAACRNEEKGKELLRDTAKNPKFWIRGGLDVTSNVDESIFEGVTQVVSCVGPVFGDAAMTSENVDYKGVSALVDACAKAGLDKKGSSGDTEVDIVTFKGGKGNVEWRRLDDVIMGGRSSSDWVTPQSSNNDKDNSYGTWKGEVIVEGGGFCGTVVRPIEFDVKNMDGLRLRVRGDGSRYKFRLKPNDLSQVDEYQYQASFDTTADQWTSVDLPFENFVAVRRNDVLYKAPPVNKGKAGTRMSSLGLVLSRFEYNEWPNPKCKPGGFTLDVQSISMYRSPRPSVVLISSAGTERFNRQSEEDRAKDIPIVKLNPQGILNWKYKAECKLRYSGLPYTVVRATGLIVDEECPKRRLDFSQTDKMVGRITRQEVAAVVAECINSPVTANKTFEVRRDETQDGKIKDPAAAPYPPGIVDSLTPLIADSDRSVRGLIPFPVPREPSVAPGKEEVNKILADVDARRQAYNKSQGKSIKE